MASLNLTTLILGEVGVHSLDFIHHSIPSLWSGYNYDGNLAYFGPKHAPLIATPYKYFRRLVLLQQLFQHIILYNN